MAEPLEFEFSLVSSESLFLNREPSPNLRLKPKRSIFDDAVRNSRNRAALAFKNVATQCASLISYLSIIQRNAPGRRVKAVNCHCNGLTQVSRSKCRSEKFREQARSRGCSTRRVSSRAECMRRYSLAMSSTGT